MSVHGKRQLCESVDWSLLENLQPFTEKQKIDDEPLSASSGDSSSSNGSAAPPKEGFSVFKLMTAKILQIEAEGVELQKAGRHEEAIKKFIDAGCREQMTPHIKVRLWAHIACSQNQLGMTDKAISCYRNAIRGTVFCTDPLLKLRIAYDLAVTLLSRQKEQDNDQAIELLRNILPSAQFLLKEDKPLLEEIYKKLTFALLFRNAEGDPELVIKYGQAGLALEPSNPNTRAWFLCDCGDGFARLGNHVTAVQYFARATKVPQVTDEAVKSDVQSHYKMSLDALQRKQLAVLSEKV